MTNEQAIEFLEAIKNEIADNGAIETVLNLLKEKDAEIQQKTAEFAEKSAEIERLNREIEKISQSPFNELKVKGILFCGRDIKQYFKKKVGDENG